MTRVNAVKRAKPPLAGIIHDHSNNIFSTYNGDFASTEPRNRKIIEGDPHLRAYRFKTRTGEKKTVKKIEHTHRGSWGKKYALAKILKRRKITDQVASLTKNSNLSFPAGFFYSAISFFTKTPLVLYVGTKALNFFPPDFRMLNARLRTVKV